MELLLSGGERKIACSENRMNSGGDRISFEECAAKFSQCVEFSGLEYSSGQLNGIVSSIGALENLPDVSELAVHLQPNK